MSSKKRREHDGRVQGVSDLRHAKVLVGTGFSGTGKGQGLWRLVVLGYSGMNGVQHAKVG